MGEASDIFLQQSGVFFLRGIEKELNLELVMSILDGLYDGLFITDGNADTILINRAYQAISGLSPEDVLGKNMRDIVANGLIDQSGTLAALEKRGTVTLEQTFRTDKTALITSTPHFDDSGNITMVITIVRDITELSRLQREFQRSREQHRLEADFFRRNRQFADRLVYSDPKSKACMDLARRVAPLDTTVLLLGETGVGKEQVARLIYENSSRTDRGFISVNCGAIPASLIESELFGYERGAFTGANKEGKKGVFESADKGTIFLDEIGELPLGMQVHLLRVMQNMEVTRVGSVKPIPVDVRIIAATNRNLQEMVLEKTFREDLFYRLNVVSINIPPLRERPGDIFPLVDSFLRQANKKYRYDKQFSSSAMNYLLEYNWPGNVRELKNVVEQAVILSTENEIQPSDLSIYRAETAIEGTIDIPGVQVDLKTGLERLEYKYIARAYERYGTARAAAASLGMDDSTYTRKFRKYKKMFSDEEENIKQNLKNEFL